MALWEAAVTVSVTEPEPVTVPGTEQVTLVSVPVTAQVKLMVPEKFDRAVTAREDEAELPRDKVRLAGLAEI